MVFRILSNRTVVKTAKNISLGIVFPWFHDTNPYIPNILHIYLTVILMVSYKTFLKTNFQIEISVLRITSLPEIVYVSHFVYDTNI